MLNISLITDSLRLPRSKQTSTDLTASSKCQVSGVGDSVAFCDRVSRVFGHNTGTEARPFANFMPNGVNFLVVHSGSVLLVQWLESKLGIANHSQVLQHYSGEGSNRFNAFFCLARPAELQCHGRAGKNFER